MALEPKTGTVGTEWEKHVELCDMTKRFWIGAASTMPVVLVGERYWRQAFNVDFLVEEGVIDLEDRELFWFAETAQDIWDGILRWYEDAGEPLASIL